MSLSISILASGSSGNCTVLRCRSRLMLIDCGIGPRVASARMKELGVSLAAVEAICLTHLDHDHFNANWAREIVRRQIRIYCHCDVVDELLKRVDDPSINSLIHPFNGQPFSPLEGLRSSAIKLAHDEQGSHGFVFEGFGARLGYATDLGRVQAELIGAFCGVDLLAIESNYDPQMQLESSRPWFLKQRIMGGCGHLSNQQAFDAVCRILDRSQENGRAMPDHIVLLHRSRQCNCPTLLRQLFSGDRRIASRLILAEQNRPTPWLAPRSSPLPVGAQLHLQWASSPAFADNVV